MKIDFSFSSFAKRILMLGLAVACLATQLSVVHAAGSIAEIQIDGSKPTVALTPHLYGLFFEDINYSADGGLYAELVKNRSFEYHAIEKMPETKLAPMDGWEKIAREGAQVETAVTDSQPLNENNTKYLHLEITKAGVAGIANIGFFGIDITAGEKYNVSLYARQIGWNGESDLTVTFEDADHASCGSVVLKGGYTSWKQQEAVLTATKTVDDARLVVTTKGHGTLDLDMISLFPQATYKGRKNGLRKDLVEALEGLNSQFFRFPGGCIVHGHGLENLYRWKDTVGDVAERKPNWNLWGYHQTYGLGYFEYFQLCDDLNMAPLPVIPIGVGCGFRCNEFVPLDELQPHIQDAIDLIEFANGPVTSKWGAVRAKMGHPEPFGLEYVCLGNEEHDTPDARERFPLFSAAIRKAYPDIKIIGTSGLGPEIPIYDLMTEEKVHSSDEHYYMAPEWFIQNHNRFDNFDRSKPKIFVGEYASKGNTQFNAVAEAAFLTGVERNGDMVDMTCYAPLFARTDIGGWRPDLIYFDNRRVMLTPNYYVQQLFGQNKGDVCLTSSFEIKEDKEPVTVSGHVGVGSWTSAIEVAEVSVNGKKLNPSSWKTKRGEFSVQAGNFVQTDVEADPAMSYSNEAFSGDTVTYSVRVRKTAGAEGFLIRFGADENGRGGYWWNLGGWGNTRHAIEEHFGGGRKAELVATRGSVETGRWYDAKIVMTPGLVECYLDGKQVLKHKQTPTLFCMCTTYDEAAGEVIVKLVNPGEEAIDARINLAGFTGVASTAQLTSLAADATATNSYEQPDKVKPAVSQIKAGQAFSHTLPAMSVEFIRLKATKK